MISDYEKRKYFVNVRRLLTNMDIIQTLYKALEDNGFIPKPENGEEGNSEFISSLEKLKSNGLVFS